MKFQDYYETLGVNRNATQDEIQKAYRKLARKFHPDVNKDKSAEEKFKAINEAYEVLKNPETRTKYDSLGANWRAGQEFQPPPGWEQMFANMGGAGPGGATFRFQTGGGAGGAGGFSDFFENLFGGGLFGDVGGPGRRPQRRPETAPANDQHAELSLSLEEAFNGTKKNVVLSKSTSFLGGGSSKTLQVKVPAGVTEGSTIRLRGQGDGGGDLLLRIKILPHARFTLKGRDLHTSVPVTPWEAVLGGSAVVETLSGSVALRIPENSQGGQQMRLKGKGLSSKTESGDLLVELKIVVPQGVSSEERELFERLQKVSTFHPRAAHEKAPH